MIYILLFFIIGLIIGSFLNVCIYRIPEKQSLIQPPSHCPNCQTILRPLNLIPVISFLLQRRKCAYCDFKISWQYPLVELLTGILFALNFYYFGFSVKTFVFIILISIFIVITFIDLKLKIIPNRIIAFGLVVGLFINIISPEADFLGGLIGFFSSGCPFLAIAILSKGGMGGGDIKMAAMVGLWLGWQQAMLGFLLAFFLGAVVGVALILLRIKSRKDAVPFGPFIAMGTLLSIFWGERIIHWYMNLVV